MRESELYNYDELSYEKDSCCPGLIEQFLKLSTPPLSPQRDDDEECFYNSTKSPFGDSLLYGNVMPTSEMFDSEFQSKVVLQDCMWSGIGNGQAVSSRRRNVSLSELSMVSTSTSCIDPTTFTAYPRQQNQVEHNYSLATPEPMRVPKLHGDVTPMTTDDSESEEDVIDVVTVDTRTQCSTKSYIRQKVRSDLRAVAQKLSNNPYKRPKCISDHDFASKKAKRYLSSQNSFVSSHSSSDTEEFCEGKRSAHNVMERHRRNELKNSLHGLRDSLPSLETQERAPKVVILSHATQHVKQLQLAERQLAEEHSQLKQTNIKLRERFAYLQSCVDLF